MIRKVHGVALAAMTLLAAGAAQAQSSVSIYGVLDASFGSFETSTEENGQSDRKTAVESGKMTTSFIGFKGTEDLGGGLKANFMLESFLRLDVGDDGRTGSDNFWARNANIGLSGGFGSVQVGRMDTLLFLSSLAFNPYGGSFGFAPTIRQTFGQYGSVWGDSGWGNAVKYTSPNFGGFTFAGQYQFKESSGTDNGDSWALNGTYLAGPFGVTLTYQVFKTATTSTGLGAAGALNDDTWYPAAPAPQSSFLYGDEQETWQIGASYDFGFLKLFGQYTAGTQETALAAREDLDSSQYQIGASLPLGGGALLASYGELKVEEGSFEFKNKEFTIGYDYNLSKRTDVYVNYMYDKNSESGPGAVGYDSGNTFAVGVRHRF